ncbi:tetraacyldisaccharide 4'-kinase [Acidocella aromatica]|uniref:Tetraacyldisaccharide 4'-kinase n=1 Tax=Acidocella aromatica TaxID=1303579 RepID=A0A840VLS7_9PROT|nr:tetraacyldisaccharide 4'-kinase [Acidocella aromatica]MBB5372541.1 tetraacyldisaccharide 4'-kinase [Acidocella aromatica]
MKAPAFWTKRGLLAQLLRPFSLITRISTARRVSRPGLKLGIKVICVGNAGVGGAGKTIVALDILSRLPGAFALTRGYGGLLAGPVLVDSSVHTAELVGDETLLLAEAAPTVMSRDRAAGARLALAEEASAIVMDDGLQNPALHKDLSLLVIDGGYGFGNGLLLPAGPLREPVAEAAARCQAAVLIGEDETGALAALPPSLPVLRADLVPDCVAPLERRRVIAFAGIGRPEKFFRSVLSLGAEIINRHAFPDHHPYTTRDVTTLLADAADKSALLVTTEKDYVKLPAPLRNACVVVRARLRWENPAALGKLLR